MLISFAVENFRSILERQEITFLASKHAGLQDAVFHDKRAENGILPCLAVFGANGTGKSNLLKALKFLYRAIENSHNRWKPEENIPSQPHFLHTNEPTTFECIFLLEASIFRFVLSVDQEIVLREALYKNGKRVYSRNKSRFAFGSEMKAYQSIKRSTRPNSLFISAAAQNNQPLLSRIHAWFAAWDMVSENRFVEEAFTARLLNNPSTKAFLAKAVSVINPQIVAIEMDATRDSNEDDGPPNFERDYQCWMGLSFIHEDKDTLKRVKVRLAQESRGTQSYLALIGSLIIALHAGSVLLLDEADLSLHPMLLRALILLFQNPSTNPKKCQLIFNTHDSTLLNPEVLRPDQVWFADIDRNGCSKFYSLAEFEGIRSDMKAQKAYLEGRFGAVPFLDDHIKVFAEEMAQGV